MRTILQAGAVFLAILCATPASAQPDADRFIGARRDACLEGTISTPDQRLAACNDAIGMNWYQHRELARLYFSRSTLLNEKGDKEAGLADIGHALKAWSNIVNDVINRAVFYIHEKKYDLAIADLDLADQTFPNSYPILTNRASAHLHRGDIDLAEKDAAAALVLKPESTNVRVIQSEIAQARGDMQGALVLLDPLIAQNQHSASLFNARCYARALLKRELAEKALPDCEMALQLAPKSSAVLDSRGYVFLLLGRNAEAIADYNAALTINPKMAASLYGRGLAKQKLGDTTADADLAAAEALSAGIGKKFGTPAMAL